MTQEQLEIRTQRARREPLVITKAGDAWNVRSAANPSQSYEVSPDGDGLACSCPDFQTHFEEDVQWQCKHVLAVQDYLARNDASAPSDGETYIDEERAAIQTETATELQNGEPRGQMLVKRSLSPDGRIDSISIEFSFDLIKETAAKLKARALKALKLQTEIAEGFLAQKKANSKANGAEAANGDGTIFGRLLDIGYMNGQYGMRYFLNVEVSGKRARLFGSQKQLAVAISAAGREVSPLQIEPGFRLNWPCRVLTEPSRDGRFLNVTQVLPVSRPRNGA